MAGEISLTISLRYSNTGVGASFAGTKLIDQATLGKAENVQLIGTTSAAVNFGLLTQEAVVCIQNLSTTESILLGEDDGAGSVTPVFKLLPGESLAGRVAPVAGDGGVPLFAVASDADTPILVIGLEL